MHTSNVSVEQRRPDWAALLVEAVSKPGLISDAYSRFWNYSAGNQILAWCQCIARGIELGPINTFDGWRRLGRAVKRGERALELCMPIRVRRKATEPPQDDGGSVVAGDGAERTGHWDTIPVFVLKRRWFVLGQTDGADYVPTELPAWGERDALYRLGIERITFRHPDGNVQGYAVERQVAVSPIAALPHKTLFHEAAHVVLEHTRELGRMDDHDATPRSLREVEAECVALIICESLGLPGCDASRGYIQGWLKAGGDNTIPLRSAQRIFRAADVILKAGYPSAEQPGDEV